ncbi:peptidase inhibitor family I36 protein [Streptomyces sp. NPDC002928]|uniref:peptidase inhibitor family I36 protein n=1 Tax=Streptomyces sp. NPDC002928 TaxID=3154440 RepID=UPI0033B139CF
MGECPALSAAEGALEDFGGQPWVRRAVDGGVKDLPSAIRDHGSSIRNNSDRTARVYEKRNYAGRWVCVTRAWGTSVQRLALRSILVGAW